MVACSAFRCTNRPSMKIPGVTFHRFPKDELRRSQWVQAVNRKDWVPSVSSRLCSNHFAEDVFDRSMNRTLLKDSAVPTIFKSSPAYLQKTKISRKTENSCTSTVTNDSEAIIIYVQPHIEDSPQKTKISRETKNSCISRVTDDSEAMIVRVQPDIEDSPQKTKISRKTKNSCISRVTDYSEAPIVYVKPDIEDSPQKETYKQAFEEAEAKNVMYRKKIKLLQQTQRRLQEKICSLKSIIYTLKNKRLVSDDACAVLEAAAEENCLIMNNSFQNIPSTCKPEILSTITCYID